MGKIKSGDVIYAGIFLDGSSLHMTIYFKDAPVEVKDYVKSHNGRRFRVIIDAIGQNDKALAFRVKTTQCQMDKSKCPCTNKTPHITLRTKNGGKPVDSNSITDWKPLLSPYCVYGVLKQVIAK